MRYLHYIAQLTSIKPDVLVTIRDGVKLVVGLAGEVLSSPMANTEMKAIYFGVDLLRYLRCNVPSPNVPSPNEVSVFVFPKLDVERFIGQIKCLF